MHDRDALVALCARLGVTGCRYAWLRAADPWQAAIYYDALLLALTIERGMK